MKSRSSALLTVILLGGVAAAGAGLLLLAGASAVPVVRLSGNGNLSDSKNAVRVQATIPTSGEPAELIVVPGANVSSTATTAGFTNNLEHRVELTLAKPYAAGQTVTVHVRCILRWRNGTQGTEATDTSTDVTLTVPGQQKVPTGATRNKGSHIPSDISIIASPIRRTAAP